MIWAKLEEQNKNKTKTNKQTKTIKQKQNKKNMYQGQHIFQVRSTSVEVSMVKSVSAPRRCTTPTRASGRCLILCATVGRVSASSPTTGVSTRWAASTASHAWTRGNATAPRPASGPLSPRCTVHGATSLRRYNPVEYVYVFVLYVYVLCGYDDLSVFLF